MLPELNTIATRRRALGLTQMNLADKAGVSQSYIAKLEAKKIEPSYSKVRAILEVLDSLEQGRETRADEIMSTEIVSINPNATIYEAVKIMTETGFSQLPIIQSNRVIGSITERTIIDKITSADENRLANETLVLEIMDDPFPQVGEDAPVSVLAGLLRIYPAILVQSRGEITGIITKADLLKII